MKKTLALIGIGIAAAGLYAGAAYAHGGVSWSVTIGSPGYYGYSPPVVVAPRIYGPSVVLGAPPLYAPSVVYGAPVYVPGPVYSVPRYRPAPHWQGRPQWNHRGHPQWNHRGYPHQGRHRH